MKKLILVNPVGQRSGYLLSRFSRLPPLSLAYVAAVTPPDWDVKIVDENFDAFEHEPADLVGISAFSSNIQRAYEIAWICRDNGTKVVLGGIHASMCPDEALAHANAVVIGESEGIWPRLIEDVENNALATKYVGPRLDLTAHSVRLRRELLDSRYFFESIQTSRGCPFDCSFCSVSNYLGKEFRQRRAEDVLEELEEISGQYVFFLDDNLIGYNRKSRDRAKAIFRGMIARGMNKRWWMQTSIDAANDEEVLQLAGKAGCMLAFIGIESIDEGTLRQMKKGSNLRIGVDNYNRVIAAFHRQGMGVMGGFIIGNDYESPAYYRALANFIVKSGVDMVQLAILTPLPGTRLMEEMETEGRLLFTDFPEDWAKYRLSYVVRKTEGVDAETIYTGNNYIKNHIYSFPLKQYRMLRSSFSIKNPPSIYAVYRFNQALQRSWQSSHYFNKYPHKLS